ncbi:hypothetical protein ACFOTA_07745 [Chitinophaga sp. GCM10012297]|uniref:Lipoprotein n=1 Tax=Chitinophaga chungangae TaxID=2821488 RepID=A0ABS3YCA4_9BACT|nr:hypothetical protein [Chitinophaga chungangae]MBO9152095.1 hypothetical protein [Chitinophaga chungangae]
MKTSILCIAAGLCLLAACGQPASKRPKEEPLAVEQSRPEALLVPGESAGKLHIHQDIDSVFNILGKPDDGDAAMGKAWGIWHGEDTLAVYSSYADSTMSRRITRQIVVSGNDYRTADGLGRNTPLETVRNRFPGLQPAATYVSDPGNDTLWVYDVESAGIAFDFRKTGGELRCTAVTIHEKEEPVTATYLTIHAGWKKLP